MRENRPYGSEGGGGTSRSLPLSEDYERSIVPAIIGTQRPPI